jgi:hypothetical protein
MKERMKIQVDPCEEEQPRCSTGRIEGLCGGIRCGPKNTRGMVMVSSRDGKRIQNIGGNRLRTVHERCNKREDPLQKNIGTPKKMGSSRPSRPCSGMNYLNNLGCVK